MNGASIWEAIKYAFVSPILFTVIFYAVIIGGAFFFPLLIAYGSWESPLRPFVTMLGFAILCTGSAYVSMRISMQILKTRPGINYNMVALLFFGMVFLGGLIFAQMVSFYDSPMADLKYILDGVNQGHSLSFMSASPAVFSLLFLQIAVILSTVGFAYLRKNG